MFYVSTDAETGISTVSLPAAEYPCLLAKTHSPRPLRTVGHHVIPQEWQKNLWGNIRLKWIMMLCDTHHYNLHDLLDAMYDNDGNYQHNRYSSIELTAGKLCWEKYQEFKTNITSTLPEVDTYYSQMNLDSRVRKLSI